MKKTVTQSPIGTHKYNAILYLILVLIMLCTKLNAQTPYYYYNGNKIYLQLDYNNISVNAKNNSSFLNSYLSSYSSKNNFTENTTRKTVTTTDSITKIRKQLKNYYCELNLNTTVSSSIVNYNNFIAILSSDTSMIKVSPCFKTNDGKNLGITNNFYVKLKLNNVSTLYNYALTNNLEVLGKKTYLTDWYMISCTKNNSKNALEFANQFYETGLFDATEPEFVYHNSVLSTDPLFNNQWGIKNTGQHGSQYIDIKAEQAWNISKGNNIKVAIFDQGCELNHPDLITNVFGQGFNAETNSSPSLVLGKHGTSCAGIVGATQNNNIGISGVAPECDLISISLGMGNYDTPTQYADGFIWAKNNDVDIISNSYYITSPSTVIDDAITDAINNGRNGKGCVVVFGSGNAVSTSSSSVFYPASANPDILVVGAASPCGERKSFTSCDGETSWESCYDESLDVVAPGVKIPTTDRQGTSGYGVGNYINDFNGTSSACPHVAGIAALVLEANPCLTSLEVRDIIEKTTQKIGLASGLYTYNTFTFSNKPNGSWDYEVGYGLVDAFEAVKLANNYPTIATTNITITSNTTWNTSKKVLGVIKIQAGGTLNITGVNTIIEFADGKKTGIPTRIEVYPGGQLIVNGATLTSLSNCTSSTRMWEGIQMIGAGNGVAQTGTLQPKVTLAAAATIKNARLAIANGVDISPAGPAPYSSGGWLDVSYSTFLNNYIDVKFLPYAAPLVAGVEADNKSQFRYTNFKADNYVNDPTYKDLTTGLRNSTISHVELNGVKGIKFIGNTFKTDLAFNPTYPITLRGRGISTNDASFSATTACTAVDVNGNCTAYSTPNSFENLFNAINAQTTVSLKTFSVSLATFTNNYTGVYQSGVNYSKVEQNKFTITAPFTATLTDPPYFYYVNNSSGFSHQENDYKVVGTQPVVATVFNNTGTGSNESYHNVYTNCSIGHQAQQTNGQTSVGYNGLQIKCNKNTTNTYDLRQTSGVLGEQGSCGSVLTPANNTFSHTSSTTLSDINAYTGGGFKYNYNPIPTGGAQDPTYKTANVTKNGCLGLGTFIYNSTTCPNRLIITGGGGAGGGKMASPIVQLQNNAISNKAIADSLTTQLNQAIANGATQGLINTIATGLNPANIKTALLAQSPYLSDDVLTAYISKQPALPAGHIKDVLIANSPVSATVQTAIDNANLPNGIYQQIQGAQAGTNAKMDAINAIGYYNHTKDLAVNELLRYYVRDTAPDATAQCIKWLEWNTTLASKTDLVFAHTAQGNYKRAQALIDSLNLATNNAPQLAYLQHHKSLKATNKTWNELNTNPVLMANIKAIAADSLNLSMGCARAAITTSYHWLSGAETSGAETKCIDYQVIEGITPTNSTSSRYANSVSSSNEEKQTSITQEYATTSVNVYPNPFNDELKINVKAPFNTKNNFSVEIIETASGIILLQQPVSNSSVTLVNTSALANGLYIVRVKGGTNFNYYTKLIKLN
jgi:hypothetical protein